MPPRQPQSSSYRNGRCSETGERYEAEENSDFAGIGRSRVVRKHRVELGSGKRYVACLVFDVTEMKRREIEAEEARRRLADVLESLPAGVVIYDRDDKFVLANRKLQDSLPGLKAVWQPGLSFRDAIAHGRELGYFRSSGDPEIDSLYEGDPESWIEAYMARHQLRHSMFERRNPDGRWFQVIDTRTEEGIFVGVRSRHHRDEGARATRCAGACARPSSTAMCSMSCRSRHMSNPRI